MSEYEWWPGATNRWALAKANVWTGHYLTKGSRKNPGWRLWRGSTTIARLNPNLTLDEAQSAAILLVSVGATT